MSSSAGEVGAGAEVDEALNLKNLTDESWNRLNEIWSDFGHNVETLNRRRALMVKFAKELYVDMIREEEKRFQEKREELAEVRKTYEKLCRLLKKEIGLRNEIPLVKYELDLTNEIESLEEERKAKMAKFDVVKAKEVEMCGILDEEELDLMLDEDEMPGDQEIKNLEEHINSLKKIKINRIAEYARLKKEIDSHFENLGKLPVTDLENYVFVSNEALKLSKEWIDSVNILNEDLKVRVEEASHKAQSFRAKIHALCHRLKVVVNEEIIPQDYKDQSLRFLSEEVDRLEALKRENMVTFISQIRDELTVLWEKCLVRPDFSPMEESQLFDDELLGEHEQELQKWEEYFSTNEVIINTIVKRKEFWSRFCELEIKSNNPDRLNNRGGALLKEDKERKESKAKCAKMRKEIEKLAKTYQEHNGESFQVFGEELNEMFLREEDQLQANIEEDKILRKNQKEENMAGNMTRRKRPATPKAVNPQSVKRGRPNMTTKSPFLMPTTIRTPVKSTKKPALPQQGKNSDAQISPSSTYSEFQNHLMCQSTLNSSRANINANSGKSPRKAPIMTPAKPGLAQQHF